LGNTVLTTHHEAGKTSEATRFDGKNFTIICGVVSMKVNKPPRSENNATVAVYDNIFA